MECEVAKWQRLLGPPLTRGGGTSSHSGIPGSARGWKASPGGPRGPSCDKGSLGPWTSVSESPVETPRKERESSAQEAPQEVPQGSSSSPADSTDPRGDFVTPLGAFEASTLHEISLGAFESPTLPECSNEETEEPSEALSLSPALPQEMGPRASAVEPAHAKASHQVCEASSAKPPSLLSAIRSAR